MPEVIKTIFVGDSTQLTAEYRKLSTELQRYVQDNQVSFKNSASGHAAEIRALKLEADGFKTLATSMREQASLKEQAISLAQRSNISAEKALSLLQEEHRLRKNIALAAQAQAARTAAIANPRATGLPGAVGGLAPLTPQSLAQMERAAFLQENLNRQIRASGPAGRAGAEGFTALSSAASKAVGVYIAYRAAVAPISATFTAFAAQEKLMLGLTSVEGSAAGATRRLEELREIARNPGLGFEAVLEGEVRLRAAGLSAKLSGDAIKEFGNALATVGGGKEELKGVTLALSQIAAKGKVSAEEINQIAERIPQIRAVMQSVFGTADTEVLQKMGIASDQFIERVVVGMAKLPRAMGGASDATQKLSDSWNNLKASLGSVVAIPAVPALQELADMLEKLRARADGGKSSLSGAQRTILSLSGLGMVAQGVTEISNRIKGQTQEVEKLNAAQRAQLATRAAIVAKETSAAAIRQAEIATSIFWREKDAERLQAQEEINKTIEKRLDLISRENNVVRESIAQQRLASLPESDQLAAKKRELNALLADANFSANLPRRLSGQPDKMITNVDQISAAAAAARATGDVEGEAELLGFLKQILDVRQKISSLQKSTDAAAVAQWTVLKQAISKSREESEKAAEAGKELTDAKAAQDQMDGARNRVKAAYDAEIIALRLQVSGRADLAKTMREETAIRKEAAEIAAAQGHTEEQALQLARNRAALLKEITAQEEKAALRAQKHPQWKPRSEYRGIRRAENAMGDFNAGNNLKDWNPEWNMGAAYRGNGRSIKTAEGGLKQEALRRRGQERENAALRNSADPNTRQLQQLVEVTTALQDGLSRIGVIK